MLIMGNLEYNKSINKIVMKRPDLVIGTDRLELYEFFGRRKEFYGLQSRNCMKICVGLTAVHFLLVQVPTLFSKFFGDQVDVISSGLGAEDRSEEALQRERLRIQNEK